MARTLTRSEERIRTSHVLLTPRFSKLLLVSGILAIIVGLGAMAGGVVGAIFTWDQAATQNVTTPDDASIPETAVRGPFADAVAGGDHHRASAREHQRPVLRRDAS